MELLLRKKTIKYAIGGYVFTFQYGATSTAVTHINSLPFAQFTFQYGATSTNANLCKDES